MPSPIKGVAYTFDMGLIDAANRPAFKANPTLAAGDFKVSKDNGALANLTDLPTVAPASGRIVKVTVTAAEMAADRVTIIAADAAGGEWDEAMVTISTIDDPIGRFTVDTGASPTSIPTSALFPAASVADQFKGRVLVFDNDTTTAALRGQATDITASTDAGVFTVTALTTAPASGDRGRIY
jgi:hypothetical protein